MGIVSFESPMHAWEWEVSHGMVFFVCLRPCSAVLMSPELVFVLNNIRLTEELQR